MTIAKRRLSGRYRWQRNQKMRILNAQGPGVFRSRIAREAARRRHPMRLSTFATVVTEAAVDDLFSEAEAETLKKYLDTEHGEAGVTSIAPTQLPLPGDIMGLGARAVGGGDDFYMLHCEDAYSIPFKVTGYFNLVGCELAVAHVV